MSGPISVAAPQRVHDRLRGASDGPLEVVHASPDLEVVSRERGGRPLTRFERRGVAAGRVIADIVAVRR